MDAQSALIVSAFSLVFFIAVALINVLVTMRSFQKEGYDAFDSGPRTMIVHMVCAACGGLSFLGVVLSFVWLLVKG